MKVSAVTKLCPDCQKKVAVGVRGADVDWLWK